MTINHPFHIERYLIRPVRVIIRVILLAGCLPGPVEMQKMEVISGTAKPAPVISTLESTPTLNAATETGQSVTQTAPAPPTATATVGLPTEYPTPQNVPGIHIHDIQGTGHRSVLDGKKVQEVQGVVTSVRKDRFTFQGLEEDGNPGTSEGLLVYTQKAPGVKVGDHVSASGTVKEYVPGGEGTGNLSITELTKVKIKILSRGNPLPEPVILGQGGRMLPDQIIDDDPLDQFDPAVDGIDFFESLEGMLVQVNAPVVVGSTNSYGEFVVLADQGQDASIRSPQGGIVLREGDFNPERMVIDDLLMPQPLFNLGDRLEQPVLGVVDYDYGNFRILPEYSLSAQKEEVQIQALPAPNENQLTIATYNLENFNPVTDSVRAKTLAVQIVDLFNSPDIIAFQEIQDQNGNLDNGVVDAKATYQLLIDQIKMAGGPEYAYREVPPENNQDGGETGGNIRPAFLFRTDRGLTFVERQADDTTQAVQVVVDSEGVSLSHNPGRIDPANPAFIDSRKPLVAEFFFHGNPLFLINLHLVSKGADTPLFGQIQPAATPSAEQRLAQTRVVSQFAAELLEQDPRANLVVLGDLNDFNFSETLQPLAQAGLSNPVITLPEGERYTYIFDGNSEDLDHILVSGAMREKLSLYEIIHVNSGLADGSAGKVSDHDPIFARFDF